MVFILFMSSLVFAAPASDFTLRDLDNHPVVLSEHTGEVILLSFWATWCTSCLGELSAIQELYEVHHDNGLEVMAISQDEARDRSKLKPIVRSRGWTFPILWDQGGKVSGIYNPVGGVPYNVLINQQGEVVLAQKGLSEATLADIQLTIESLMGLTEPQTEPEEE